jgi:hypothetical protein
MHLPEARSSDSDGPGNASLRSASGRSMSALGLVWPAPWQELSTFFAALVRCGHVSGLLVRQIWPLDLMLCADRVPNKNAHFKSCVRMAG